MKNEQNKVNKLPEVEIDMENIPEVEMPKIDVSKYIGKKAKIIIVIIYDGVNQNEKRTK